MFLLQKAWELAYSPGKSIFMTAFMMWMSGSSVNIFSIMITIYSFWNPFKAILQVNNGTFCSSSSFRFVAYSDSSFGFCSLAFSKYGADSGSGAQQQQHNQKLLSAKLVFILFNLLSAGIAVYKGYTLGILPTTPADWLQFSGAGTASSIQTSTYAAGMEL